MVCSLSVDEERFIVVYLYLHLYFSSDTNYVSDGTITMYLKIVLLVKFLGRIYVASLTKVSQNKIKNLIAAS